MAGTRYFLEKRTSSPQAFLQLPIAVLPDQRVMVIRFEPSCCKTIYTHFIQHYILLYPSERLRLTSKLETPVVKLKDIQESVPVTVTLTGRERLFGYFGSSAG